MLFNSLSFAVFFPTVVISYYLLPERFRTFFLLVASCVFYMAFVPSYILILFAVITIDFFLAQLIVKNAGRRRLILLWGSIAANLGILFFFKYFNFFNVNVAALADFLHWNYDPALLVIALPLGLSFHVFQSLAYVIEVYKSRYIPERNYWTYSLYVMFFPQLVAGPIERPAHLLPQFREGHPFNADRVRRGLERMLWGFFKKLVIADNIAPIVSHVYAGSSTEGPLIIAAAVLFTYQLYCDFSGYSDIAVGTALVLGYDIRENFDRPYAARSMAEFWRRWHISLSSWLRDYLFTPLFWWGRHRKWWAEASLFISFVLIGLWHGANWTYVTFGALNGFYIVFSTLTSALRERTASLIRLSKIHPLRAAFQMVFTFMLFTLSLIFFRASNLHQAWNMISNLGTHITGFFDIGYLRYQVFTDQAFGATKTSLLIIVVSIVLMEIIQYIQSKQILVSLGYVKRPRLLWNYALLIAVVFFGNFGAQTFIYFQF